MNLRTPLNEVVRVVPMSRVRQTSSRIGATGAARPQDPMVGRTCPHSAALDMTDDRSAPSGQRRPTDEPPREFRAEHEARSPHSFPVPSRIHEGLRFKRLRTPIATLVLALAAHLRADWPALHGNARHDGFVSSEDIKPPFRLVWVRHLAGERLGTAMEPIVAEGRVFVATHSGSVCALDAETGAARWSFAAHGPFLHSPTVAGDLVVAGSTDGCLYALDAASGKQRWSCDAGYGGFSASPTAADDLVFIGTRSGDLLAVELGSGKLAWRQGLKAPIRQTAAVAGDRVFVTAEDLRVRCFDARSGTVHWTSELLAGQTARDYYPILVRVGGRTLVIVRTNPVVNMAQRIARDRHFLAQNAGVDDSDWRKVDAWGKSEAARGSPELWEKEQHAIVDYLKANRDARSCFVLDAETGQEALTAPVLWIAGCQGGGAQPALTSAGRLLVFYRSAYGNWNHGVAPLVALGLLDLAQNRITPLFHQYGMQPAWNTFWGTADESQNFTVAGNTVLIVHQGTLSGFDLTENRLFPVWGERDTFGGFKEPWFANEWHGPGRGSVAVVGRRVYWMTGSRILCLVSGEEGKPAEDVPVESLRSPQRTSTERKTPDRRDLQRQLAATTAEFLSRRWAPLFVDPGLAGREFFFDDSGEVFEALAWAYPHLSETLKQRAKAFLAEEWNRHPPFTKNAWYPLNEGERREWFRVAPEVLSRLGQDKPPHPFGNMYPVWLWADRCGEWDWVKAAWPQIRAAHEDFARTGWRLDPAKGDLDANRYLGSLIAFGRIADRVGDDGALRRAKAQIDQLHPPLLAWWRGPADPEATRKRFAGSAKLDPFIGGGDGRLFFRVAPHRHKPALIHGLTPDVLAFVTADQPGATSDLWAAWSALCPTWSLQGEERQVHFGENFVDPPDLALDTFKFLAWSKPGGPPLAEQVDLPFCRADLYYLTKLALALELDAAP